MDIAFIAFERIEDRSSVEGCLRNLGWTGKQNWVILLIGMGLVSDFEPADVIRPGW
jgi:hypothetical protein